MKNVLVAKGGGSSEHEISLISAKYIESQINKDDFQVLPVEIDKDFNWSFMGKPCLLTFDKILKTADKEYPIDVAIPIFHGYPGETGDIQSFFEILKLPYLGCKSEASVLCFNKLATKLWLETAGLKTTPFLPINSLDSLEMTKAIKFLKLHKVVYTKATNQGSSVGCYRCESEEELKKAIKEAFIHSPFVILEKEMIGRELEVSAFEYDKKIHITPPGEIECPDKFYSYDEKYSQDSNTKTHVLAPNIPEDILSEIKRQAQIAFESLKLRHLSRIDFFLTKEGEVVINEINTFPGHTQISMFPMMMENYGVKYSDFLNQTLHSLS